MDYKMAGSLHIITQGVSQMLAQTTRQSSSHQNKENKIQINIYQKIRVNNEYLNYVTFYLQLT
jgi:hypothetical protein